MNEKKIDEKGAVKIYLDKEGNQVAKGKLIPVQNGPDDQEYEEVLLSDSERAEPTGEILSGPIF